MTKNAQFELENLFLIAKINNACYNNKVRINRRYLWISTNY